ncbi:PTS sugar transporter subunit IIB [Sporolactobacillus putidus]|uniref:PTS fructose transporter subunit IIB n=1 Tax=Sporolactobacillus putidus TaxID=492735 RepID=A0A917W2V3_9BACL|nr:PTS fructose transporter subunit IIB [Sporolactobacillus putidus]GGL61537.1 PTS fructose transporter subunit IIB [Sporolactobacillus putidus]
MIKILTACGAGVNSSHQIADALESEMRNRGYEVQCEAVMIKDVTEDMVSQYDILAPIVTPDLGFDVKIPIIECGPILYRIPAMAQPVYDEMEKAIKSLNK